MLTELKPKYQKSFYKKAYYGNDNYGNKILFSYNTPVVAITHDKAVLRLWKGYSSTTMNHINEFFRQNNIKGGGKKWWEALPITEVDISKLREEVGEN